MIRVMPRRPVLALSVVLLSLAGARAECRLPASGAERVQGRVSGVADGRTLRLDDGRDILLAGLAPGGADTQKALQDRLAGQSVTVGVAGAQADRYGRLAGYVFVNGAVTPVQYALLREGLARVDGRVDNSGCRSALLAQERHARAAGFGLWGDKVYDVHQAASPDAILGARGRFGLVEGRVLSVRESGGTIYVNFGRRWSEDFTATIPKRLEQRFTAAGLPPKSLAGRHVRLRGFVEERGGPWIELTHPGQIEWTTAEKSPH